MAKLVIKDNNNYEKFLWQGSLKETIRLMKFLNSF